MPTDSATSLTFSGFQSSLGAGSLAMTMMDFRHEHGSSGGRAQGFAVVQHY